MPSTQKRKFGRINNFEKKTNQEIIFNSREQFAKTVLNKLLSKVQFLYLILLQKIFNDSKIIFK